MVLEDYREFHDFIVKSIPRFMPFGQRNLNLIEKMDLMRIDIFCADVGESFFFSFFFTYYLKKGNRYSLFKDELSFTGNKTSVQKLSKICDIAKIFLNI